MLPQFMNWGFIAHDVSAVTLDVKAAVEKENKTKFILIAVGTIAALFFILLIAKRG